MARFNKRKQFKKRGALVHKRKSYTSAYKIEKPLSFKVPYPDRCYASLKNVIHVEFNGAASPQTLSVNGCDARMGYALNAGAATYAIPGGLYNLFGSTLTGANVFIPTGMYNRYRVRRSHIKLTYTPLNAATASTGTQTIVCYPTPNPQSIYDAALSAAQLLEQKHVKKIECPAVISTKGLKLSNSMKTAQIMGFSNDCMVENGEFDSLITAGTIAPSANWYLWQIGIFADLTTGAVGTLYGQLTIEMRYDCVFFEPNFATQKVPT